MKSIINGKIYLVDGFKKNLVILFNERIEKIISVEEYEKLNELGIEVPEEIDAKGAYVVPGFIDIHIHGYDGVDTMDGKVEAIRTMAKGIGENGVTAFLPTTMTMPKKSIIKALEAIEEAKSLRDWDGAMVLGAHMEGPFINVKYKGAQSEKYIALPEEDILDRFLDTIKIVTIAPEVAGAFGMIEKYGGKINFSLGHTGANYEQAKEAYDKGAKSATHLFNAMTGLHHRESGVVGAALTCDVYTEVVADNFHLSPVLYQIVEKAKGLEKILLMTDCIQAGGLREGSYQLGGQSVIVENGQCRLQNGTIAGSVLKLNQGLKNFTEGIEKKLSETIRLVTLNQAKYLGCDKDLGSLERGKLANIVLMDASFNIITTIVKGKTIYEG